MVRTAVVALAFGISCGGTVPPAESPPESTAVEPAPQPVAKTPEPTPEPEPEPEITYPASGAENLALGRKALDDKDWHTAAKYFVHVMKQFPYSKNALTAELGYAEAELGNGNYKKAFDSYDRFGKFHPTHEVVTNGYVEMQKAKAQLSALEAAVDSPKLQAGWRELERFYTAFPAKYPKSPHVNEAKAKLAVVKTRLKPTR